MDNLISAPTLATNIENHVIIDCRFSLTDSSQGEHLYSESHIEGARYAHLDTCLSGPVTPQSGRHPLPDFNLLIEQIGAWGIDNQTRVVAYDDAAGMFASRLWWLLRTLGHHRVAVLNGGVQTWQAAGLPLVRKPPKNRPVRFSATLDRDAWKEMDEVKAALDSGDGLLVDARAKERFDGIHEPIDPIAGHIPGSVNMPITENLDENGFFLEPSVLRANYLGVIGETAPEKVIHSCGSGVFACFGILAMELAGLKGSKLYPGSWSEWISDPKRGIATTETSHQFDGS